MSTTFWIEKIRCQNCASELFHPALGDVSYGVLGKVVFSAGLVVFFLVKTAWFEKHLDVTRGTHCSPKLLEKRGAYFCFGAEPLRLVGN